MKILVITRNAWDDTNAIGNTLSNFFGGIDDLEFANIYFRSARPSNKLCRRYYRTSELEIVKKWFSPKKIGKAFTASTDAPAEQAKPAESKEKTLIRIIQKHGIKAAYKLSDRLWYSRKWINENLKAFVEDFAPDVIFSFVKSAPQYYLTVKYLRESFNAPLLSWIADDEYTALAKNKSSKEIENLRYILKESAVVKGCSEEICQYYNSVFGCNATPLYKGCDLSAQPKDKLNAPLKMVYAGNLLYGRLEILRRIAELLEKYTANGKDISFEIFSNTSLLPSEIQENFNNKRCTKYMGRRDYETVKQELASADIVLHVESFDEDQILKTKYSFSTKIIDCLQSGGVILAVGPKEIASIKYIMRIPGACVINSIPQLKEELFALLNDSASFAERTTKTREFAKKYHDAAANSKALKDTLEAIIKEEA